MSSHHCGPRLSIHAALPVLLALLALFVVTPACGGGGGGGLIVTEESRLIVENASLPTSVAGERVDIEIPLTGGCGGPYTLALLDGEMPDGVRLDDTDGRHRLVGAILEAG